MVQLFFQYNDLLHLFFLAVLKDIRDSENKINIHEFDWKKFFPPIQKHFRQNFDQ